MHTKRGAMTAQGTTFIQWCALTWDGDGDGGGDTGEGEFVAVGDETFQPGVQHADGLLVDGLVQVIRLHPLGLLSVNLGGNGINFFIELVELLLRLAE